MKKFVPFIVCAIILFTLIPQSYAEIYYHDRPSWSIEYPDGWNVWEEEEGIDTVHFMDGSEKSALFGHGIWKNHYFVLYNPDYGEWESEKIDRDYQIENTRANCEDAEISVNGFTCDYFEVFHEMEATLTVDGYPIITTVFKNTNYYGMLEGTPGVGVGLMRSNGTTGAVELADGSLQAIGHMGRNTGVDTEYHEVILNI